MHVYDDDISLFAKIPVYEYLVKSHLSKIYQNFELRKEQTYNR